MAESPTNGTPNDGGVDPQPSENRQARTTGADGAAPEGGAGEQTVTGSANQRAGKGRRTPTDLVTSMLSDEVRAVALAVEQDGSLLASKYTFHTPRLWPLGTADALLEHPIQGRRLLAAGLSLGLGTAVVFERTDDTDECPAIQLLRYLCRTAWNAVPNAAPPTVCDYLTLLGGGELADESVTWPFIIAVCAAEGAPGAAAITHLLATGHEQLAALLLTVDARSWVIPDTYGLPDPHQE